MDVYLQSYLKAMRSRGAPVGSSVVVGVARGMLLKYSHSSLAEFGGHINLTKGWDKSVLRRMGYTKRRGSSTAKVLPSNFEEMKELYLIDIMSVVEMEEIPSDLIINWDHTALKLVPSSSWTMEKKGSKRVEIVAIDDKRQITCVLACTLSGHYLPVQLIYQGMTSRCHPCEVCFPGNWHITQTPNHWANEDTTIDYVNKIIIPYVNKTRENLNLDLRHSALVIFDVFKGQCT